MGFKVALETERSEEIESVLDVRGKFNRLLALARSDSCCLRFVDPYQITTFNQGQAAVLADELSALQDEAITAEERVIVEAIARLVSRCAGTEHLYVKFYGD